MVGVTRSAILRADPFIRVRIDGFAAVISEQTGVAVEAILGRGRTKSVAAARRQLMARLWGAGLSLKEVGLVLGMHHTSVMSGLRKELGAAYQASVLARYTPSYRGAYRGEVAA